MQVGSFSRQMPQCVKAVHDSRRLPPGRSSSARVRQIKSAVGKSRFVLRSAVPDYWHNRRKTEFNNGQRLLLIQQYPDREIKRFNEFNRKNRRRESKEQAARIKQFGRRFWSASAKNMREQRAGNAQQKREGRLPSSSVACRNHADRPLAEHSTQARKAAPIAHRASRSPSSITVEKAAGAYQEEWKADRHQRVLPVV